VNPDGISPDISDADSVKTTFNDNFTYTGFRVPVIVISPFSKKGFVSHTPADYTAILKLIETRFDLGSLTKRDAAQFDMTEFFDFTSIPNAAPPAPPAQLTSAPCYFNALP
jgi:phospholipase C